MSTIMLSLLVRIIIWTSNEGNLATKPKWVFYVWIWTRIQASEYNWICLISRRSCGDEDTRGASEAQVNIDGG